MRYCRENVSGYVQSTKREGVGGDTAGRAYGIKPRLRVEKQDLILL